MKIQTIHLTNFKAIADLVMDFKGCSAIVTGRNNSGKTSFLRGLIDRIRFDRPKIKVKEGATEGSGELTLDNGDRFVWDFNDAGRDKLTLITKDGQKANVTTEIGAKFFPPIFDIDKFLQSTPKDQVKQLQAIVGMDFTEIDKRYKFAYDERTRLNEDAEVRRAKLEKWMVVEYVAPVDMAAFVTRKDDAKKRKEAERMRLNELYLSNKKANEETRAAHAEAKKKIDQEVSRFSEANAVARLNYNRAYDSSNILYSLGFTHGSLGQFLENLKGEIKKDRFAFDEYPAEPKMIDPEMPTREDLDLIEQEIEGIDAEILKATETNQKAKEYQDWIEYKKDVKAAKDAADQQNSVVVSIEQERKDLVAKASFPEGISISSSGVITVDGFPLDRSQISTSKLYTAALRIASMNLGEVKTLYFDASFLDRNSLAEINEWAAEQDLQLLIERPDYEAGDIQYTIIE